MRRDTCPADGGADAPDRRLQERGAARRAGHAADELADAPRQPPLAAPRAGHAAARGAGARAARHAHVAPLARHHGHAIGPRGLRTGLPRPARPAQVHARPQAARAQAPRARLGRRVTRPRPLGG